MKLQKPTFFEFIKCIFPGILSTYLVILLNGSFVSYIRVMVLSFPVLLNSVAYCCRDFVVNRLALLCGDR